MSSVSSIATHILSDCKFCLFSVVKSQQSWILHKCGAAFLCFSSLNKAHVICGEQLIAVCFHLVVKWETSEQQLLYFDSRCFTQVLLGIAFFFCKEGIQGDEARV